MKDGVIKFACDLRNAPPRGRGELEELINWREILFKLGLIGRLPDGIGFGNLSQRCADGRGFIISGSGTGAWAKVGPEHFTRVLEFDLAENRVVCEGPIAASSESLTHAAIYQLDESVGAVMHVHSRLLWDRWLGRYPETCEDIPYGTVEMARDILRLWPEAKLARRIVMRGHEEGLIAFGRTLEEAGMIFLGEFPEMDTRA